MGYRRSWSVTRHKMLMECESKWAFHYLLTQRGKFNDQSDIFSLAWRLKHMTNLPLYFGKIVHDAIEKEIYRIVKTGKQPDKIYLVEYIVNEFQDAYEKSKNFGSWYREPRENLMFHELYYKSCNSKNFIESFKEKIEESIENFIKSDTISQMIRDEGIKLMEAEKYRSFEMDSVKIFLSADIIFQDRKNNNWKIVDWKTGRDSTDDPLQLAVYGLYLQNKHDISLEQIELVNEYLQSGMSKSYRLNKHIIQNLQHIFQQSMDKMIYLEEIINYVDEKDVLKVLDKTQIKERCERCNFKAVCQENLREEHIKRFALNTQCKSKKVKEKRNIDYVSTTETKKAELEYEPLYGLVLDSYSDSEENYALLRDTEDNEMDTFFGYQ